MPTTKRGYGPRHYNKTHDELTPSERALMERLIVHPVYADAAKDLGVTVGTVRERAALARQKMGEKTVKDAIARFREMRA